MQALEHPPQPVGTRRRWVAPAATGGVLAVGVVAIALVDPSDSGAPVCLSQSALGIDCPLCGGLRCVNALARGDLLAAADHNVVLAVALPLVAVLWAVWLVSTLRGRTLRMPRIPVAAWAVLGVGLVAFTVARNLGTEGWVGWLAASASP